MKKHIKKIIAVVSLLVACVAVFAVTAGAFYIDTDGNHLGVNVIQPRFIRTDGDSYEEDTIPFNLYENSTFISDVIRQDGQSIANNYGYMVYYAFMPPYYSTDSYLMAFDTMQIRRDASRINDTDGLLFEGVFTCDIYYDIVDVDGNRLNSSYHFDSSVDGDLPLISFIDTIVENGGLDDSYYSGYIRIVNFEVETDADTPFYCGVQYYHYGVSYSSIPLYPITLDNTSIRVNTYIDNIPVGDFLWNSVKGFLNVEIVSGVTLYELFIVVVSIPLCIWLLKLFAGG